MNLVSMFAVICFAVASVARAAPPEQVFSNPGKFCEETERIGMAKRYWRVSDLEMEELLKEGKFPSMQFYGAPAWVLTQYPDLRVRKHVFWDSTANNTGMRYETTASMIKKIKDYSRTAWIESLSSLWSKPWPKQTSTEQKINNYINNINVPYSENARPTYESQKSKISKLCALIAPLKYLECKKAYKNIFKVTQGYEDFTLLPTIKEFFVDDVEKYNGAPVKGAVRLAKKIIDRIEKNDANGDLYTDAINAFKMSGLSKETSTELAWKFLGIISTNGGNTAYFLLVLSTEETLPIAYSVQLVTLGISVLNSLSKGSGHLYMYPKSVKGECDNGKYYHFWMSAFLAHKNLKIVSPDIAAKASYYSDIGYQFSSTYGCDRDPPSVFFQETFAPFANKIRIDLAAVQAGTNFGAGLTTKNNIDKNLQTIFSKAFEAPVLSETTARSLYEHHQDKAFLLWMKIIGI